MVFLELFFKCSVEDREVTVSLGLLLLIVSTGKDQLALVGEDLPVLHIRAPGEAAPAGGQGLGEQSER